MTPNEVLERIEKIRKVAWNAEAAHGGEDRLWHDVLKAISGKCPNSTLLATLALTTRDIEFPRWYA